MGIACIGGLIPISFWEALSCFHLSQLLGSTSSYRLISVPCNLGLQMSLILIQDRMWGFFNSLIEVQFTYQKIHLF